MRSRRQVKTMNNCNPTALMCGTNSSLFKLLSESIDPNEFIGDVYFSEGMICDITNTDPKFISLWMVSVGREVMNITYYNLLLVNSGTISEDGLCV